MEEQIFKYTLEQVRALKADIKALAEQQPGVKNQRKTVNLHGERILSPREAQAQHSQNRYQLRHMYIAYGIMRNKPVERTEANAKVPHSEETVKNVLEAYEKALCSS